MVFRFVELLKHIQLHGGPRFTGVGLVLCDTPDTLPIVPIHVARQELPTGDLANVLAQLSQPEHELHDGFHIISSEFELTRPAQYFSPPIILSASIDRSKPIGGRYMAALFGSAIPGVVLTGISSLGFGISVFRNAREIAHEAVHA